jgi:glucokinase
MDDLAVDAVRLFARLLGRFAGDLALVFGTTGGVFVGGGIAPRLVDVLKAGHFRAGFEDKAPYADLMRQIPAWVIMQPVPAFAGLSAIASSPGRFRFTSQTWAP